MNIPRAEKIDHPLADEVDDRVELELFWPTPHADLVDDESSALRSRVSSMSRVPG